MKILDIGCGNRKGYQCPYEGDIIGVDMDRSSQADKIWDLEKFPYPFKKNEFDAIYMRHSLEHLENTQGVMEELWRITKPGGRVYIAVPYGVSDFAHDNVTHKKFFSPHSILNYGMYGNNINNNRHTKFRVIQNRLNYWHQGDPERRYWKRVLTSMTNFPMNWLINLNHRIYGKLLRHYFGDADEIIWELEVLKGDLMVSHERVAPTAESAHEKSQGMPRKMSISRGSRRYL